MSPSVRHGYTLRGMESLAAFGYNEAMLTLIQILRGEGLKELIIGWDIPGSPAWAKELPAPPDGFDAIWVATATFWHGHRPPLVGTSDQPTSNFRLGIVQAVADILRQMGAEVTLVTVPGVEETHG